MNQRYQLPDTIKKILKIYNEAGFEAYVVGGAARDVLLGIIPHDYDIASSASPDEGLEILEKANIHTIDTSKKHGTIIAIIDGEQIEVTTYRVDGEYSDSRHPDQVVFTRSIEEDVVRRDFTMNAIYLDSMGQIVDLLGGEADIKSRTIRACGEAGKRFTEDALRILRAIRFSATYGFEIEESTKKAIFEKSYLLKDISKERIATELLKLLTGKFASKVVREYLDVLGIFIPELIVMRGFDQKSKYHDLDLLEHTLGVLDGISSKTEELCVAALLHDVGKPVVFKVDEEGFGHMKQHNIESVKIASKFLDEYKFSNSFKKKVLDLIYMHDIFPTTRGSIRKYIAEYSVEFFDELRVLQKADICAHSEYGRRRLVILEERDRIIEELLESNDCLSMKDLAIGGNDLIGLGIPKGPEVGKVLKDVFDKVLEGELPNTREKLIEYIVENR